MSFEKLIYRNFAEKKKSNHITERFGALGSGI